MPSSRSGGPAVSPRRSRSSSWPGGSRPPPDASPCPRRASLERGDDVRRDARHRADGARVGHGRPPPASRGVSRVSGGRVAAERARRRGRRRGARRDASAPHLSTAGEIERLRASAVALSAGSRGGGRRCSTSRSTRPRRRARRPPSRRGATHARRTSSAGARTNLAVMRDTNVSATPRGDAARRARRDARRARTEGGSSARSDAAESGGAERHAPENKTPARRNAASIAPRRRPRNQPTPPTPLASSALIPRGRRGGARGGEGAPRRSARRRRRWRVVEAVNREHLETPARGEVAAPRGRLGATRSARRALFVRRRPVELGAERRRTRELFATVGRRAPSRGGAGRGSRVGRAGNVGNGEEEDRSAEGVQEQTEGRVGGGGEGRGSLEAAAGRPRDGRVNAPFYRFLRRRKK